ncbi:hypothetical protein [Undibacterium oligocarboniphilum]|uniref:Uncharacterized protein n=1 Tax=Undibacterium oligocarboniphilum TaxID=666702 RepID=A0A850QFV5_9BURK|nr:hypothetical protein [Undibacterium oligocarboniphilum]MBC3871736.1 hypothetical protein [Undibacterium oligocarboniphilum]NVO79372.1 hypothetical protein [Undibacterium oligocarboniphilum]
MKVTFWKFVNHTISTTPEEARALAEKIESGEFVPHNNHGERFYKWMGYCYDIGRVPYLIQYSHGSIERAWGLSVKEIRESLYLKRSDKVIPDPFLLKNMRHLKIAA